MKKEKIEEILLKFSYKVENKKEADLAFNEFYKEYSQYLNHVIWKIKLNYPLFNDLLVDRVVTDTFVKMYNNPFLFKIDVKDTDKDVDSKLKAYLTRMAKNHFIDLTKKEYAKEKHLLIIDDLEVGFDPPDIKIEPTTEMSIYQKLLKEVLQNCKERDRRILLSIYQQYEKNRYSNKEFRLWLAKAHNTTEDNIRQIKSRCDKKIRDYFDKNLTQNQ